MRDEFVVHSLLIERAVCGLATHRTTSPVVHRVRALLRAWLRDHDRAAGAGIARKQDRMARSSERRVPELWMARRKGPRCAFAMHPALSSKSTAAIRQQFSARDVVADEVHE